MTDLRALMDCEFSQVIGVFENHSVAHGQNTEAWVQKPSEHVSAEANRLLEDHRSEMTKSLAIYLDGLTNFLRENNSETVDIRHHYAWWYPKWLDGFLADLR